MPSFLSEPVALPIAETLRLKWLDVVVVGSAILMMVVLYLFVQRSKLGTAIRAVSEDAPTAALMGINVDRAIVATFAIGAAMAGVAGVLFGLVFIQINFLSGFIPGIKAFTAAVLGGIGNIPGAMVGGMFLGRDRIGRAHPLPRGPRRPVAQPAQGRRGLHSARPRARLPTPGHPR